jgi:hypothetical protein
MPTATKTTENERVATAAKAACLASYEQAVATDADGDWDAYEVARRAAIDAIKRRLG